jgi:hypothetical protein
MKRGKAMKAADKRKLVDLLTRYVHADGAHIAVQQRAYNRYMSYFEDLERRYPQIAFRSEDTQTSLVEAAKRRAAKKLFRGPGSTQ